MAHLSDSSVISTRYANAVFGLATESGKTQGVVQAFVALAEAVRADTALAEALQNLLISRAGKADALQAALKGADEVALKAVRMIALKGRSAYLPAIADALAKKLAAQLQEVHAEVISAAPLSSAQQAALTEALKKATGKSVVLKLEVNKAAIGGFSVKLGSLLIDGTLAGQLERIKQQLKQAA